MSYDPNISPVGWYVARYLLRFVELQDPNNEDLEKRFLVWENTVLVRANNLDEAYEKTRGIAEEHTEPYKGGAEGVPVRWVYEGVSELLPIYEEIADGAEIMFSEYTKKLKNIRARASAKKDFFRRHDA